MELMRHQMKLEKLYEAKDILHGSKDTLNGAKEILDGAKDTTWRERYIT